MIPIYKKNIEYNCCIRYIVGHKYLGFVGVVVTDS